MKLLLGRCYGLYEFLGISFLLNEDLFLSQLLHVGVGKVDFKRRCLSSLADILLLHELVELLVKDFKLLGWVV